jgi:hypothetical protein
MSALRSESLIWSMSQVAIDAVTTPSRAIPQTISETATSRPVAVTGL